MPGAGQPRALCACAPQARSGDREGWVRGATQSGIGLVCGPLAGSLEEVRRRTKVIARFPGETSCLTMAWAVMDLVIAGSRGLGLTLPDRHAIAGLVAARSAPRTAQQIA